MALKIDPKKQVLVGSLIMLGIILVGYILLVVQPLVKKIMAYNAEEKTIQAQLKNAGLAKLDKEKLAQDVDEITKKIAYYEGKLPQNTDIPQVLDELIMIGRETNVTFDSIEPQKIKNVIAGAQSEKQYQEIPIEIKVRAGFHEFAAFVNRIENFPRFMKITEVKIAVDNSDEQKQNIKLIISAFAVESRTNANSR
ncbi:MAG: type 4a pilus biogenesis protein PilO [Candidatus Omnitrophica bacterium]|jgi:type IV pilus assembly protein PilO|nr:type 4a pilus biogenesis protein PilO [Candidatus Omnitrophota bacterium]